MLPPPLLTDHEHNLLDAIAFTYLLDKEEGRILMWQLPLENRAYGAARAIVGYNRFPLDRFSRAVASKKLAKASRLITLARFS